MALIRKNNKSLKKNKKVIKYKKSKNTNSKKSKNTNSKKNKNTNSKNNNRKRKNKLTMRGGAPGLCSTDTPTMTQKSTYNVNDLIGCLANGDTYQDHHSNVHNYQTLFTNLGIPFNNRAAYTDQ